MGTLTFSAPNTALILDGSAAYNFEIAGTTASPISDLINLTGATSTVSFAGDWTLNVSNLGTVDPTGLTFVLFDYTASGDPSLGMPTINYGAGAARWSGGTVSVDSANTRVVLSGITLGPPPIISATAALTAFTTIYGTPSTAQSFTVSGTDMIAGILVSPPPGFEVSLSIGSGYAGTITVGAAGSIAETPVYVRLSATAPIGTYNSKNIVLSSSEAANVNVTTSASDNEVTRTAFDLWALINCPAGQRLMTDDPDGDNQNNLTEFALGGTPNNGALNAKVYSFVAESSFYNPPQGKELVLTIAVLKGTPAFSTAASPVAVNTTAGVTYTIQSSTTMSFPDASTAFPVTKIDTGLPLLDPAKHEYRSFVLMNSNGLPAKGFLRVKVEPNP